MRPACALVCVREGRDMLEEKREQLLTLANDAELRELPVGDSILDGLGIGAGFTVSLTCMGLLREFFGAGTFFGMEVGALPNVAMSVFVIPAGGFIMFGLLMALINFVSGKIELKRQVPVYEQTDDDMPEEVLND